MELDVVVPTVLELVVVEAFVILHPWTASRLIVVVPTVVVVVVVVVVEDPLALALAAVVADEDLLQVFLFLLTSVHQF